MFYMYTATAFATVAPKDLDIKQLEPDSKICTKWVFLVKKGKLFLAKRDTYNGNDIQAAFSKKFIRNDSLYTEIKVKVFGNFSGRFPLR